ncbi:hypothetical protein [Aliamphritea spongicola]|nr:hypothetical protein [Aliamphritea spongicola]
MTPYTCETRFNLIISQLNCSPHAPDIVIFIAYTLLLTLFYSSGNALAVETKADITAPEKLQRHMIYTANAKYFINTNRSYETLILIKYANEWHKQNPGANSSELMKAVNTVKDQHADMIKIIREF